MEMHSTEQKAADRKAIVSGFCPECSADLRDLDPAAHAELHWPEDALRSNVGSDAARRKAMLLAYADRNTIDVTPQPSQLDAPASPPARRS